MIQAVINRSKDGSIQSFSLSGHAQSADYGKDLVCAGASAVVFGSINAVMALAKLEPILDLGSDGGYLRFELPEELEPDAFSKAQLLLEGMLVSLQTIERDYSKYMKVRLKNI
ncbi:ribosomal-processing cysteine protease Prp [Metabacillus sp. GX 13764]|uniref:ribosomal-processing cysteine protease Prp n=1 Tax=Metabacillus kandeliae TaxID=2900151 RepID=UPI001E600145|nr:ribosomal-processing cysteine protease Prp [Metabacillus kandeliae]MCD7032932.1 ribosomal-processing cysteine protease Prp [Metabacillus kandeliae]